MFSPETNGVALGRYARLEMPGILMSTELYSEARTESGRIIATCPDGTQEVFVMGARRFSKVEEEMSNMTHISLTRFTTAFEQTGINPGAIFLVLDTAGTTLRITVLPKATIDRLLPLNTILTQAETLLMHYSDGFQDVVRENGGRVITFCSSGY